MFLLRTGFLIGIIIYSLMDVSALSYPTTTPSGETAGGTYRTYFDNMFAIGTPYGDCADTLQVVSGFTSTGVPLCVTPTAAGFSLLGQTSGDTVRYDGTSWVRNNLLYNNGTAIGIGNQSPAYILDVAGTANFLGFRMPTGAASGMVLASDVSGVARWTATPTITSMSITGGTQDYVIKFGPAGVGLVNSQLFDNGTALGIGTATPTAGYKVDISGGDILLNTLRIGRGGGNILSNSAFGWSALGTNTTATTTTAVGYGAFSLMTSGAGNVGIGNLAGSTLTSGSNNILIGNNAQPSSATTSNELNIGNWIYGSGGFIGVGTATPGARLEVAGQVKITGGTPGAGKYLGSDATGLASWQTVTVSQVTATGITGGTADYITKFGPGGNGIYASLFYETGIYIGLGNTNPTATLDISGNIRLRNGAGSGLSLVSDASGVASWQSVSASTVSASGVINGTQGYIPYFGTGGNGLYSSLIFQTGGKIGLGNTSPGYTIDVSGTGNFTGLRLPTGASSGMVLTSDTTGNVRWSSTPTITANSIVGSSGYYLTYFGSGGNGLYPSGIWHNNTGKYGINTTNPTYMFDIQGSGSIIRAGSGFCLGFTSSGCLTDWSDLNNIVKSRGTANYIAKFNSGGFIDNSQLYETGGNLYIGDIPGILGGSATIANITIESPVSTNSSRPFITLSENGGQECRMWITGSSKIGSNCQWAGGTSGFNFQPNQIIKADSAGTDLTGSVLYSVGNNVGIGITSGLAANLHVSGSTLVTGNLTVQGSIITDTIVNRTVNNVSISGSLLPNTGAPLIYRDIGSSSQRWNNLYLSGQIAIGGGVPGLGKILTSDATGLASWTTVFSGTTTASGITGGTQDYIPKFGPSGNGLILSQMHDNGINIGIGSTGATSKFEIWSGTTVSSSLLHFRGANNVGLGLGSVRSNQTGNANTGLGAEALFTLSSGYSNTAVGYKSQRFTGAGFNNSSLGQESLGNNNGGSWNSGLGYQSAFSITSGTGNVALGARSMYNIATGNQNIAIGYESLFAVAGSAISNNVAIGNGALYNTTASNNVAIGTNAGDALTSGSNNIAIGYSVDLFSNTASNQLNIGNWIYGSGGNIGIGTGTNLTSRLNIDSGTNGVTGLRLPRVNNNSPVFTGSAVGLGIDAAGNVVPVSNGDVVVYDGLGRSTAAPVPDPDIAGRRIRYDFNKYFQLPTKQSFVVTDGNGAGFNAPYFKEDGVEGICSYNGASGTSPYDCAVADPVTGLSASPNNSFTMTARGTNFGYQIALGARGDAPLFARSGRWFGGGTNYGSGLYLSDGTTPTPWQKVLTVPANHIEYFYVNIGYNSQLQEITGGGNIGMGTSTPDMRLVLSNSGTVGSTSRMMRIERGIRGADVSMVNAFGTPYLMIGGRENRTNSIQTIGFGYNTSTSFQPAEIGFLTTNTAGNTQGDIVFANRNATTNTAPSERMRIFSDGNVSIGSTTNTAMLKVNGTFNLGTNGTTLNSILKAAVTHDVPSVGAGTCALRTLTVTNATVGGTVAISPSAALADRMAITYARVSAANTIEVKFCNESVAAINLPSMVYAITVIQ